MSKNRGASSKGTVAVVQSVVHKEEGRQVTGLLKELGEPAALALSRTILLELRTSEAGGSVVVILRDVVRLRR